MRDCGYARFPQAWKVHAGRQKLKLDEETRWQIAGEVIEELRRYGGWKELDEEAPMRDLAPGTGPHEKSEGWKGKPEKKKSPQTEAPSRRYAPYPPTIAASLSRPPKAQQPEQ